MSLSKFSYKKLEKLVKAQGISYYFLSKELGFPTSFFSEWKKGKMMPKIDKLKAISDYFGVPIEYFIE